MVYLLPLLSYLAGSESVYASPPVRQGYDDKFRSRSYRFVERQKLKHIEIDAPTQFSQRKLRFFPASPPDLMLIYLGLIWSNFQF